MGPTSSCARKCRQALLMRALAGISYCTRCVRSNTCGQRHTERHWPLQELPATRPAPAVTLFPQAACSRAGLLAGWAGTLAKPLGPGGSSGRSKGYVCGAGSLSCRHWSQQHCRGTCAAAEPWQLESAHALAAPRSHGSRGAHVEEHYVQHHAAAPDVRFLACARTQEVSRCRGDRQLCSPGAGMQPPVWTALGRGGAHRRTAAASR